MEKETFASQCQPPKRFIYIIFYIYLYFTQSLGHQDSAGLSCVHQELRAVFFIRCCKYTDISKRKILWEDLSYLSILTLLKVSNSITVRVRVAGVFYCSRSNSRLQRTTETLYRRFAKLAYCVSLINFLLSLKVVYPNDVTSLRWG